MQVQVQRQQESLAGAEQRIYDGETIRRKLHNIIQELKGNIRVFCRVRPVSVAEQVGDFPIFVRVPVVIQIQSAK